MGMPKGHVKCLRHLDNEAHSVACNLTQALANVGWPLYRRRKVSKEKNTFLTHTGGLSEVNTNILSHFRFLSKGSLWQSKVQQPPKVYVGEVYPYPTSHSRILIKISTVKVIRVRAESI